MLISVCIPVYNRSVCQLVGALVDELEQKCLPIEVVLYDDGSDEAFHQINKNLANNNSVAYFRSEQNYGRSFSRNRLAEMSEAEYLLFLDCDSLLIDDGFLEKYSNALPAEVLCGAHIYAESVVKGCKMHHIYGRRCEVSSLNLRNEQPYKSFYSSNFLIKRKLFKQIKFNEEIAEYGHEDTIFGIELKRRGISVVHFDNPVFNNTLDHDREFVQKQLSAVRNLVKMKADYPELYEYSSMLKLFEKYKSVLLLTPKFVLKFLSFFFKRLVFSFHSVSFLQLYKLSCLALITVNNQNQK